MSVRVATLTDLSADDAKRLIVGYESTHRYDVRKTETADRVEFSLELVELPEPFSKRWTPSERLIGWHRERLAYGLSFGAWHAERLVGLAITWASRWNREAIVEELHVEASYRGQGIGRTLLEHVERAACDAELRAVGCETQVSNVPGIAFYRACGYSIHGIDLTHYTNEDVELGEVAVFMKKMLET